MNESPINARWIFRATLGWWWAVYLGEDEIPCKSGWRLTKAGARKAAGLDPRLFIKRYE